eukprot:TRINITY_DN28651_c0_g1_i1.p1 TRINITY_DN28651_c0_g1~~TRINITY_DN28651_c0_g1_i1.p1  ORF type:complete len:250 (-),score=25.75 TRINITY_DN28651_c0_g1_i1:55-804(-)
MEASRAGQAAVQNLLGAATTVLRQGAAPLPPPGKRAYMACGFSGAVESTAPFYATLQRELANSYYWCGSCFRDYVFFVCNWHPLLGIILCHPNHPWSKMERLSMTLISLAICMVPSAVIGKSYPGHHVLSLPLTVLFVSIPDFVCGVILYQVSIAETRCPALAPCFQCLTHCLMCIAFSFGLLSSLICASILHDGSSTHWATMLGPLVYGKAISYLTWFPLWLLLPCNLGFLSLWNAEKQLAPKTEGLE